MMKQTETIAIIALILGAILGVVWFLTLSVWAKIGCFICLMVQLHFLIMKEKEENE